MDLIRLQSLIDDGLITRQKHPVLDLHIYNYTSRCQFAQAWNEITLQCRGLILDGEGNIVQRPFPKFFNLEDHSRSDITFTEDYLIFDKYDGSLGIGYESDDGWAVATRGSFTSIQAIEATRILRDKYPGFVPEPGYTYLWEIIYPENRIVVHYDDMRDLVFLTGIHVETGANRFDLPWPGPRAEPLTRVNGYRVGRIEHPRELKTFFTDNAEGFVLFFPNGNKRVKIKFDEYVRLHRVLTGFSEKSIWESMRKGDDLDAYLDNVPDEFYAWVKKVQNDIARRFAEIHLEARQRFLEIEAELGPNYKRIDFAEKAKKYRYSFLLFAMKDDKDVGDMIMKLIKPEGDASLVAFWNKDTEAV